MKCPGLKVGDIILMAFVAAAALLLFLMPLFAREAKYAEIMTVPSDGRQVVPLSVNATYELRSNGVALEVSVFDGRIFVSHSDCRDGICAATPPISSAGQTIVCAPAGVVVRVLGEEAVVDGVSG